MKTLLIIFAIFFLATITIAQSVFIPQSESTKDVLLTRMIQLADGKFHKLEIKGDGVYLDEKVKGKLQGSTGESVSVAVLIMETSEYWNYPDLGFYYILGIEMATGMCGIPTYAAIHVDESGNIRVSKASPSACIGDFPISVEFKLNFKADVTPIWKLSTALEFDGRTFLWKDLQKLIKPKAKRKK